MLALWPSLRLIKFKVIVSKFNQRRSYTIQENILQIYQTEGLQTGLCCALQPTEIVLPYMKKRWKQTIFNVVLAEYNKDDSV